MDAVSFDPGARDEFLIAVEHYEACQPGLGRRFRLALERQLGLICKMPFRFRVLHPPFRRCLIPRFPYSVIFAIEPEFILVVAVAHAKRKPGYWLERVGGNATD